MKLNKFIYLFILSLLMLPCEVFALINPFDGSDITSPLPGPFHHGSYSDTSNKCIGALKIGKINLGIAEIKCKKWIEQDPRSNYFDPSIIVKYQVRVKIFGRTSTYTKTARLSAWGQCKRLHGIRLCARPVPIGGYGSYFWKLPIPSGYPIDQANSDRFNPTGDPNAIAVFYQRPFPIVNVGENISVIPRICVYEDPWDLRDVQDDWSPFHRNQPFSDDLAKLRKDMGTEQYKMPSPAVEAYRKTIGKIFDMGKVPFNYDVTGIVNRYCVQLPLAPYPPPYTLNMFNKKPQFIAVPICERNKSSRSDANCLLPSDNLALYGSTEPSDFEYPRMMVMIKDFIQACQSLDDYNKLGNCVFMPNGAPDNQWVEKCADDSGANGAKCFMPPKNANFYGVDYTKPQIVAVGISAKSSTDNAALNNNPMVDFQIRESEALLFDKKILGIFRTNTNFMAQIGVYWDQNNYNMQIAQISIQSDGATSNYRFIASPESEMNDSICITQRSDTLDLPLTSATPTEPQITDEDTADSETDEPPSPLPGSSPTISADSPRIIGCAPRPKLANFVIEDCPSCDPVTESISSCLARTSPIFGRSCVSTSTNPKLIVGFSAKNIGGGVSIPARSEILGANLINFGYPAGATPQTSVVLRGKTISYQVLDENRDPPYFISNVLNSNTIITGNYTCPNPLPDLNNPPSNIYDILNYWVPRDLTSDALRALTKIDYCKWDSGLVANGEDYVKGGKYMCLSQDDESEQLLVRQNGNKPFTSCTQSANSGTAEFNPDQCQINFLPSNRPEDVMVPLATDTVRLPYKIDGVKSYRQNYPSAENNYARDPAKGFSDPNLNEIERPYNSYEKSMCVPIPEPYCPELTIYDFSFGVSPNNLNYSDTQNPMNCPAQYKNTACVRAKKGDYYLITQNRTVTYDYNLQYVCNSRGEWEKPLGLNQMSVINKCNDNCVEAPLINNATNVPYNTSGSNATNNQSNNSNNNAGNQSNPPSNGSGTQDPNTNNPGGNTPPHASPFF